MFDNPKTGWLALGILILIGASACFVFGGVVIKVIGGGLLLLGLVPLFLYFNWVFLVVGDVIERNIFRRRRLKKDDDNKV